VFNTVIDAGQVAHKLGAFQSTAVGLTAFAGVFQALLGFGNSPWRRTVPMEIGLGRKRRALEQSAHARPGERYGFSICSLENFPLGMRPFGPSADGLRYIAWDTPLRRLVALTPATLMGWDSPHVRALGLRRGSADEFTVRLEDNFILDGESFAGDELRISPGHEVQFLVP